MIKTLAKFFLNKVIRWRFVGSFPEDEKYIIAVVPHSSYFDLIIAVLIRTYSGIKIKFIGKKELFRFPLGLYFRWMGGEPIDRSGNQNKVEAIAEIFEKKNEFRLSAPKRHGFNFFINKEDGINFLVELPRKVIVNVLKQVIISSDSVFKNETSMSNF